MRDIIVIIFLACFGPMMFRFAHIGLYLWVWVSIMNPHKLVFGIARGQSFNLWIAVITIGVWLFSKERKVPAVPGFSVLTGIFAIWITLTTALALTPDVSWPLWERNIKTLVLVYLVLCIITTRTRLHALLWVHLISIGYWGAKSGLETIASAGNAVIVGPASSMITDNNHLALAIAISIPIANYLRLQSASKIIRWVLIGAIIVSVAAIIGTYSRGGLVALVAMVGFLWWRGSYKLVTGATAIVVVYLVIGALPEKYIDRASTITTAEEDSSFQSRLDAWEVALQTALDRPIGAGFAGPQQPSNWYKYKQGESYAAHSIYFMVLGEHGFLGLILYMSIIAVAWFSLSTAAKISIKLHGPSFWGNQLATALKCSIFTFMVGGAALSLSYYDGFWLLMAVSVLVPKIIRADNPEVVDAEKRRHTSPGINTWSPRPAE